MAYWKYSIIIYVQADTEDAAIEEGRQLNREDPGGWDEEVEQVSKEQAQKAAYYLREN